MKTKKIKLHVRVASDGGWICEGQYVLADGTFGRIGVVDIFGITPAMDSVVIIEAEIPVPPVLKPPVVKTVQGTVAPGQKET